jgi:hypothetical protein
MVRVAVWVVLLILLSPVVRAQESARLALVIGNQDYVAKVGPLRNPRNDAALIEAALTQLGFKVRVLKDASYKAMDSALKRYVTEVRRAGRNALSFFYYSGHGVANPETQINYLIPVDVSDADDDKVWFESFQQNTIIDLLSRQAPNATHYVVFDACRNELNIAGTAAKALGTEKGFVPVGDTAGLLIAYATAPRKTASDIGDGGGPYAKALAEELVKPGIEAVTMFRNVQLKVKQTIGQDPWLSFPSLPAVYFAGARPQNVETTFWVSVKDSKSPTVLNTYLERYPDGEFASLARALIEHYERQLQVEQVAREEELRRQEEVRKASEAKRLEAVAAAEGERLAAIRAAEEAKERGKTTDLASPIPEHVVRDPEGLTRALQRELARVGCYSGAVDGRWGAKANEALREFSRHAKVSLSVDKPTEDALRTIAAIKHPVCILRCAAHQKVSGGRCVSAKSEQPAAKAGGRQSCVGRKGAVQALPYVSARVTPENGQSIRDLISPLR